MSLSGTKHIQIGFLCGDTGGPVIASFTESAMTALKNNILILFFIK